MSDQTLLSLFAQRVVDDGPRTALHVKRGGQYAPVTWDEFADDVRRAAAGLFRAGVRPGDRVIQLAENRYEWIVADFAVQFARAIHTPVHAPLTGEQIAYQISDSGATIVLLSGDHQASKLRGVAEALPLNLQFFSYDPCDEAIGSKSVAGFAELQHGIDENAAANIQQQALANVTPDSLATILYTSGTTGEPKGVMLSQGNLTSNALATLNAFEQEPEDLRLSFLPMSHIFGRTCDLYTWIIRGSQLALAESRETIIDDCRAIHPTLINGVPYFFDKVYRAVCEQGNVDVPGSLRAYMGGRLRMVCAGGAALPDYVYDFFVSQGIPILQGYGLTETSPVISASRPSQNKKGCVGPAIPDVEIQIAPDGEILTRGPHVMQGYYKNPAATEEVIKDGWFYTGDLGELDDEGFLRITGRKKEIIVTSGGKNIAPVLIESLLTQDPLIVQALVVGDGRNFLSALIVPDADNLRAEIIKRGIAVASREAALAHADVRALFRERIGVCLQSLSPHEQIRQFTILGRGFSIECGEMTAKLSLRRKVIEEHLAEEIDAMYSRDGAPS